MGRFLNDYGMVFVLLLLCAFFSLMTLKDQRAIGSGAGEEVSDKVISEVADKTAPILIAGKTDRETEDFATHPPLPDCNKQDIQIYSIVSVHTRATSF